MQRVETRCYKIFRADGSFNQINHGQTVFILFIGTHKEYDKIEAAKAAYKK
jgi:hypothetical protein